MNNNNSQIPIDFENTPLGWSINVADQTLELRQDLEHFTGPHNPEKNRKVLLNIGLCMKIFWLAIQNSSNWPSFWLGAIAAYGCVTPSYLLTLEHTENNIVCSQQDPALRQCVGRERKESERQKCCFYIFFYTPNQPRCVPQWLFYFYSLSTI